ncbi:uncharacterized protein LOC123679900 [Harmonia axyridis]|uniref:uncharacterized protein LOC123679900 n=1 Tax=Harmonia axyridis TaxID=115357 RepID=UPI001E277E76|nr:uncharacterized protein LOC123679900 [Harmonia axyridis]
MFKIVETVENNRKVLTIVPTNWETNRTLSIPRRFASKLQRESDSVPEPNWITLPCKVKRSFLPSFEMAEEELDRMVDADETDRDDRVMIPAPTPCKRPRVSLPKKICSTINDTANFNYLANSCIINDNRDMVESPLAAVPALKDEEQNFQSFNLINSTSQQTIQQMETFDAQVVSTEATNNDNKKLDTIMTTLETVLENQHKIMKELSNFQVVFEMTMKKKNASESHSQNNCDISPIRPIDSLETLKEFNEKLNDPEVFTEYVNRLSFICGRDTRMKGIDHGYLLVDKFFTRNFFTLCSWAGGARVPNSKFGFKFYENVINLFFKLVHLADQKFSLEDCEDFFKGVIRNCVRRNNALNIRTSRSKNRPKELSYNAQDAGNASKGHEEVSITNNEDKNMEPSNDEQE